jgi:hypothetical protein
LLRLYISITRDDIHGPERGGVGKVKERKGIMKNRNSSPKPSTYIVVVETSVP